MANSNRPIAPQDFDKGWRRAKVKAGIKDAMKKNAARIHDLRHTFATQTANENWPPAVACKVLDMSIAVYMRTYVHITRQQTTHFSLTLLVPCLFSCLFEGGT